MVQKNDTVALGSKKETFCFREPLFRSVQALFHRELKLRDTLTAQAFPLPQCMGNWLRKFSPFQLSSDE